MDARSEATYTGTGGAAGLHSLLITIQPLPAWNEGPPRSIQTRAMGVMAGLVLIIGRV